MNPQAFKLKFKYDTALMNLVDAEIADALEEADLVVKSLEFAGLKERAVGLYAAHILKIALKSKSGNGFSDASSMSIAGQSVSFSRSGTDAFYNQSIYGQRYLALKNSIPIGNDGTNPNRLGVGAFIA